MVIKEISNDVKKLLDVSEDAVHIINSEGIILYVNSEWEKMQDKTAGEVLGKHINDIMVHWNFSVNPVHSGGKAEQEQESGSSSELSGESNTSKNPEKRSGMKESVAMVALREKRSVSTLMYSHKKNRLNVTSMPVFENDEVLYVITIVRNLTKFYEEYDELNLGMERNRLYSSELEFYRNRETSSYVVGESMAIKSLLQKIEYVAATDATILITGESGTGKEVLTNEIYRLSKRNGKPFMKINCAAIPESLIESELFGHEKGAFTGAVKTKPGMFEVANTGTLMLDEIGELPKAMQSKLLRVLQEREIMHVGGTTPIPVDVRLICATNQNLEEMVERGDFRKDLYYRINLIPLSIPPLRERPEDIQLLAEFFLNKFNAKYNRHKIISENAIRTMKEYPWPGNIRELENMLERLVIIGEKNTITSSNVRKFFENEDDALPQFEDDITLPLKERVENYEKEIIQEALLECGSTYSAARLLNCPQPTLARKAKQYGLKW